MEPEKPRQGPLLEATGADIARPGDSRVVRVADVNWTVHAGEYWVVGGPADSGKTELLQTAAGLQPAAGGSVKLFGEEAAGLAEPDLLRLRTRVGYVFKGGGRIFADMTVAENIALPLRYHRNLEAEEALEAVHALLHLTELGDIGQDSPQHLAGGMRQRVGLARALALRPEILFLDEPLAGFGWRHRQWWLDFLQQLTEGAGFAEGRKTTVVATTNDFGPWTGRSARFAQIRDKRWEILGDIKELPNI